MPFSQMAKNIGNTPILKETRLVCLRQAETPQGVSGKPLKGQTTNPGMQGCSDTTILRYDHFFSSKMRIQGYESI
jgi:hypothetical protein